MHLPITVCTFYSFTALPDPFGIRAPLLARMQALEIRGTITLAPEGINATISGAASAIARFMHELHARIDFTTPTYRESYFDTQPFQRAKIKVKPELISLGPPAHPAQCVGTYISPKDWNGFIACMNPILIDTRNDYEFACGHFAGAINPGTSNFKDMVAFTKRYLDPSDARPIAMYCTGGIRCDKYSSYLIAQGFTGIYHLHGGILAYLEQMPEAESLWQGTCFVFDARTMVAHGLTPVPSCFK